MAKKKRPIKVEGDLMTGMLRMHPRGFGFVQPDYPAKCPQDIFIPKHLTDGAVDGDHVEVEIDPNSNWEKGPEGKIAAILKRGRTHLGGTVHRPAGKEKFFVYCPLLGSSKPVIVQTQKKLKLGDRVILQVEHWGNEEKPTTGEVTHYLGHISDPSVDTTAAIEEYDLRSAFPKAAVAQAKKWGKEVPAKELKNREDFTELKAFTIDPETAKDFDDALSIFKDKKGGFHLGVHIADVAHYVQADSPLDKEAIERCNSTYFPGFCLPMLPHDLSDNLCSLRPNVIRLTISVLMDFDKEGNLQSHRVARSYIKSVKRFSYEEAKKVIDGLQKSPQKEPLDQLVELCLLLKKKRFERGSIDFSRPDLVIEVDEKGIPRGTRLVEYDISHQLVEECMLKANEVVAKHLSEKGKGAIFRIHEEPSSENMEDFYTLARTLGFPLPKEPTHKEIQELFEKAKKTPFGQQLSIGFIRSLRLAFYSPDNVGHWGLALDYYGHFTSPIRRYTDLITERLLFDEAGEIDLDKIASKCSERERISFRAESSVKLLKKLRLLDHKMKEDPYALFPALVTRVKPFGLFFEVPSMMLEGFLHISELDDDYFVHHPEQNILVGRHTHKTYRMGESLTVRPISIDLITLETKWELLVQRRKKRR